MTMPKFFFLVLAACLLIGCANGERAEKEVVQPEDTEFAAEITLAEYIELAAQILCLTRGDSNLADEALDEELVTIFTEVGVTEEAFLNFAQKVENMPDSEAQIFYQVIGKMTEYCEVTEIAEDLFENLDLTDEDTLTSY